MRITEERWDYLSSYSRSVFGSQDERLERLLQEAEAAGLPAIDVGPEVGRLLMVLTAMTGGRLALEVGTLGGYSGLWLTRGLAADGRLITIEKEPRHAEFAREQFERAGVSDRVDLRLGAALDRLPEAARELGPESVDVVFLDALKSEYHDYWGIVRPLIAPGGLILADNVYASSWWIGDEQDETRIRVDHFNRAVASDPEFEAVAVPLRNGVL
ncbi:MAG: O-methyltransferase, partial [Planctomycetota bacterium]